MSETMNEWPTELEACTIEEGVTYNLLAWQKTVTQNDRLSNFYFYYKFSIDL